ncbi:hypothetical protein D3C77_365460 [compost metagenome]
MLQYIQMYPGPITTVGGICIALGNSLRVSKPMSREVFLLAHYRFVKEDGSDCSNEIQVHHLADDNFIVSGDR